MAMWWNLNRQHGATCLYGEITVLATSPCIYYCGANWHPGEPAGGYCGIQHHDRMDQPTIFSIWDTSAEHHSKTTAADIQTIHKRFGGEGTGEQTFLERAWTVGELFQFFVQKQPSEEAGSTDTGYFIIDRNESKWRHVATITTPNGGHQCVTTIGTSIASFLENWRGRDITAPKLALYRLWLGSGVDAMTCLTSVSGDDNWGKLNDSFFLAQGDPPAVDAVFRQLESRHGMPVFGGRGKTLPPISDRPIAPELLMALRNLPSANRVDG